MKLEHINSLNYLVQWPEETCLKYILGETVRSVNERVLEIKIRIIIRVRIHTC